MLQSMRGIAFPQCQKNDRPVPRLPKFSDWFHICKIMTKKQRQKKLKPSCFDEQQLFSSKQQRTLGAALSAECSGTCQQQTKLAMKKATTDAMKTARALSHKLQHPKQWSFNEGGCSAAFIYALALCDKGSRNQTVTCEIGTQTHQYNLGCGCDTKQVSVVLKGAMHPKQIPNCFQKMEAWTDKVQRQYFSDTAQRKVQICAAAALKACHLSPEKLRKGKKVERATKAKARAGSKSTGKAERKESLSMQKATEKKPALIRSNPVDKTGKYRSTNRWSGSGSVERTHLVDTAAERLQKQREKVEAEIDIIRGPKLQ